jgi:hypothetical protein
MDFKNAVELGAGFTIGFLLVLFIIALFLPMHVTVNGNHAALGGAWTNLNPSTSFMS